MMSFDGQHFYSNDHPRRHLIIHSNKGKQFRIHTEDKSFNCDFCDKKFNRKGTLKRNLVIHTGETPFQCEFCEKKFNMKGNLTKHLLIHTRHIRNEIH